MYNHVHVGLHMRATKSIQKLSSFTASVDNQTPVVKLKSHESLFSCVYFSVKTKTFSSSCFFFYMCGEFIP